MARSPNWSEDEVRKALALYLVTDFGKIHRHNPDIISLASQIERTTNAVALKLANLAALDNTIPQKGMANASNTDRIVWKEFLTNPTPLLDAYDQDVSPPLPVDLTTKRQARNTPSHQTGMAESEVTFIHQSGNERRIETTQRIGQGFFRRMILTSYRNRCALTGIEDSRLLNASHIVPWKNDDQNRLNPSNGICLNTLHDRAFDRHLITFDEDYRLIVADHVPIVARQELERSRSGRLELPTRFLPNQSFLEAHRRDFYEKSQNAL